jgi:hypothetical protein
VATYQGKLEEGYVFYKRAFDMDPQDPLVVLAYGFASLRTGRGDEGLTALDRVAEIEPDSVFTAHALLRKHAVTGEKAKAFGCLTQDMEAVSKASRSMSWFAADSFAILGEKEKAMDWLETAVSLGLINYRFFAEHDPYLADIRGEPRFQKIIESAKEKSLSFEV